MVEADAAEHRVIRSGNPDVDIARRSGRVNHAQLGSSRRRFVKHVGGRIQAELVVVVYSGKDGVVISGCQTFTVAGRRFATRGAAGRVQLEVVPLGGQLHVRRGAAGRNCAERFQVAEVQVRGLVGGI